MKVSSQIDYSSIGDSSIGKRFSWGIEPIQDVQCKN